MDRQQITGVILAGGLGRRMGGLDKGLQLLAGRPLVSHIAAALAPQVGRLVINANRSQADYAAFGYPLLADCIADFAGPLAGLHAALQASKTPLVMSVPCDTPNFPADLVSRLHSAMLDAGSQLAIVRADGRLHPVFCLCQSALAPELALYLRAGGRRVAGWCADRGAVVVDFDGQPENFRNFNTLDELQKQDPKINT